VLGPAPVDDAVGRLLPGFQRANLGLALSAAQAVVGELRPDATAAAIAGLDIRGRAQVVPGDPTVILDAAHNADGARALAEALPELTGGEQAVCCLAILEGKDAEAITAALAPQLRAAVCTEVPADEIAAGGRPGGRSRPASELAAMLAAEGVEAEAVPELAPAVERGLALAREAGAPLLVTGSHFLIGSALGTLDA
jgi:dihydrofolate synthase/folylpolyglutamate synthase